MTPVYLAKKLLEHGANMRKLQKAFFKEQDPVQRKNILALSKQSEKEFDQLLISAELILKQ